MQSITTSLPVIDSAAIVNWPSLGQCNISNNGKYFMYSINNNPRGKNTFIIKSTENEWKKRLINIHNVFFSPDNKRFFFQSNDSLCSLLLGTDRVKIVDKIISYSLPSSDHKEWLAYLLKNNRHELILHNLLSDKKRHFTGVTNFSFEPNGKTLLLQIQDTIKNHLISRLDWIDLADNNIKTIWSSSDNAATINSIITYQFNENGNQLVFLTADTTIWYYAKGSEKATIKLTNRSIFGVSGLSLTLEAPVFSHSSKYLFFQLQSLTKPKEKFILPTVQVDVWTYKDSILPFKQAPQSANVYKAAMDINSGRVTRIEGDNDLLETVSRTGDFAVINHGYKNLLQIDYWWPSSFNQNYWLLSLKDGSRKKLASIFEWGDVQFSPNSRYLMFYDYVKNQYCSYQISTGTIRNISGSIDGSRFRLPGETYPFKVFPPAIIGTGGWLPGGNAVLVYDQYDIWQLDITGKRPPINLTNGIGNSTQIKFRIVYDYVKKNMIMANCILLSSFDTKNKYTGIYRLYLKKKPEFKPLIQGPWTLLYVTKAANNNAWIFRRETATDAPNYYLSYDLKIYKPLSNLQPQKKYNWLTTELITWKQLDSSLSQGILYKPVNFDSTKKYPLIFLYYEERSQNMYRYLQPEFAQGEIDISWYVSRGYLVFTPDIHYGVASLTGKVNGDYVVNAVVSAANYLAKRPYIDANRMGLQGHSFGGGETLYLVTHSNMFAAACAAASTVSNEITAYLGITRTYGKPVGSKMLNSEAGHNKIGTTLWKRPDLYIKASPVFRANSVTTPLLLMHNLGDGTCDFNQSAEMFMALRRLGKKVWLLQYDNGAHIVYDRDAVDYTKRMQQFFDHYLKGVSPPVWMKENIPANSKDIESGLELDISDPDD